MSVSLRCWALRPETTHAPSHRPSPSATAWRSSDEVPGRRRSSSRPSEATRQVIQPPIRTHAPDDAPQRYADLVEAGKLTKEDFRSTILSRQGWLKVEGVVAEVVKE